MEFHDIIHFIDAATSYSLSIPLRKGNIFWSFSSWVNPCTNVTGIRNTSMKAIVATSVAILRIQSCLYGMQMLDQ